jgi:hypothetical protein
VFWKTWWRVTTRQGSDYYYSDHPAHFTADLNLHPGEVFRIESYDKIAWILKKLRNSKHSSTHISGPVRIPDAWKIAKS